MTGVASGKSAGVVVQLMDGVQFTAVGYALRGVSGQGWHLTWNLWCQHGLQECSRSCGPQLQRILLSTLIVLNFHAKTL